jgi:hypothetical protein
MEFKIPLKKNKNTMFQFNFLETAIEKRFISLAGGRRVGKTMISLLWLLLVGSASAEGINVYIAPTMRQAIKIGLRQMLEYIVPNCKYKWNSQTSILTVMNHEYMFVSSDNIDAIRGFKIANALFTEAAFQKEEMFTEIVRPALADLQGKAFLESTYNGYNWFWKLNTQNQKFFSACWPTAMNKMIKTEELENLRDTMTEDVFKQEILAIPTTAQGLVFGNVFSNENIIEPINEIRKYLNDGYKLYMSIDYGYNDPTAVGFFLIAEKKYTMPTVIKIHEIVRRKMLIEKIMAEIIEWFRIKEIKPENIIMTCDAAGNQHTGVSENTYISQIEKLRIFTLKYKTNKNKLNVINMIRAHLKNACGKRNYFITNNCIETIAAYTTYEIKDRERPYDDSKIDHIPDSDGYLWLNVVEKLIPNLSQKPIVTNTMSIITCQNCKKQFATRELVEICNNCRNEITGINI